MRNFGWAFICLFITASVQAQKPALDHTVYDGWQSIGEKAVSNNGKWIAYAVNPQQGDGVLIVKATAGATSFTLPRAYQANFSNNSRYLVARIKPFYEATRAARIKKKSPADMPKDSLLILDLEKGYEQKIADVKSYQMPEKAGNFLAYHLHKSVPSSKAEQPDSLARLQTMLKTADSLAKVADSLRNKVNEARIKGMEVMKKPSETGNTKSPKKDQVEEGTELVVRDLQSGKEWRHKLVTDYKFADFGQALVIALSRKNSDTTSKAAMLIHQLKSNQIDTIATGFVEAASFAFTEDGTKLAMLIQKDSTAKALKKFYELWLYESGKKQAGALVTRASSGVQTKQVISENLTPYFSKNGSRLYFGLAQERRVKDTSLVDFETAKLDVWNYKDDYLQPQQLVTLNAELKKSWLTVYDLKANKLIALGGDSSEIVMPSNEGDGKYAIGMSNLGMRIEQQWKMDGAVRLYTIDLSSGQRKLITPKAHRSTVRLSPTGQYTVWYDPATKNWMVHNNETGSIHVATNGINVALFDEEHDTPSDPPPHGLMGWKENDLRFYIYDKYDIWEIDPTGKKVPTMLTAGWGRKNQITIRNQNLDRDKRFISNNDVLLWQLFNNKSKGYGWMRVEMAKGFKSIDTAGLILPAIVNAPVKAKESDLLLFAKSSPEAENLYTTNLSSVQKTDGYTQVSNINPQQSQYNWFTVELHQWTMLDGKVSEGLLYKPENFDPNKKYPVIFYFYEKNADRRYDYIAPMPVRASINIAYYTSNGYLVFDPNIYYKTGQPGEDAYNAVVSAARYVASFPFADSTKMGLQGHSWGGYQIAYLITRTNMFAAAEAGAPVSNMTSAYGGIRWGTGISRQFQYEQTQSRIGATLWEKPELYLKNSPLFSADKVNTPLLMLHNDKDDAVPWYQGIEYFTALRRLGKPVWMINYNDELHGIIDRKNRKDWTIRMAQFFDHYLKGAPAPRWMSEGVPATLKGIDWGLD